MARVLAALAALLVLGGCYVTPQQQSGMLHMQHFLYQQQQLDVAKTAANAGYFYQPMPATVTCRPLGYGGTVVSCSQW